MGKKLRITISDMDGEVYAGCTVERTRDGACIGKAHAIDDDGEPASFGSIVDDAWKWVAKKHDDAD